MTESDPSAPGAPAGVAGGSVDGSRQFRLAAFVAAAIVLLLVVGYVGAYAWVGSDIPRGTSVAGVEIGGMSEAEAVDTLDEELADRARSMQVSVSGKTLEVSAARLGLSFDAAATVASVPMRRVAPQALFGQVAGQEVAPATEVDQARLDRAVRRLARSVDDPVRQARIEFDDLEPVLIAPKTGTELDRAAAAFAIADSYVVSDEPVSLDPEQVVPYVSEDEAQAFAANEATAAVSAPIDLELGETPVQVSASQIAEVLSYRATESGMTGSVDAELLRELVAGPLARAGRPARDATFDVSSGTPRVVPSSTGRGVDDESLASGVMAAIESPDRFADLELERIEPDLTTAEAKDLGVTEQIASYTQVFPYAAYRVTNIGLASEKINGTVLEPGETFSLNGIVGERTPENGFVEGFVIQGGRLVEDYGGAVSTITTSMWNTAFYAGMTRIEQRAHGFWISRYIAGLEATVSWGYLDLKFRNDTPYGVLVTSSVTDTSVTTTMWSTKYWDIDAEFGPRENFTTPGTIYDTGPECVPQTGVTGFDITVTRVWSRNGEVERREELPTHYDAAPTVICGPEPSEKPEGDGNKPDDSDDPDDTDKPGGSGGGSGSGSGGDESGGGSGGGGSGSGGDN